MARSYKKYAGNNDRNTYMKNYANRKIRRVLIDIDEDWVDPIPNHKGYRKNLCPWCIRDWGYHYYGGFQEYRRERTRINLWWDRHWSWTGRSIREDEWDEDVWRKDFNILLTK